MKTGEKLKAWRTALDLNQREAAERAHISQAAWCEYESDEGASPKVDVAVRIAALTYGSPHYIAIEEWASPNALRDARKQRAKARKHLSRTG